MQSGPPRRVMAYYGNEVRLELDRSLGLDLGDSRLDLVPDMAVLVAQ